MTDAPARWRAALAGWAVPARILIAAPEPPWGFPPRLFAPPAGAAPSVLHTIAREGLSGGGRVLDVGCGGGAASVPLAGAASHFTGVDTSEGMLAEFAAAASAAGVAHREVLGAWPEVAADCPQADVVVCRHVVYDVPDIAPFVAALAHRADRLVVVECSQRHPSAALAPLWQRFWGLARPDDPTADLFVEVVESLGYRPVVRRENRPVAKARADDAAYVAFVRRRLCLGADRDPEIAEALREQGVAMTTAVTVAWTP